MLNLPATTEYGKRIPKQKFYENLTVSPALKRVFVEQIKLIYWRNKLAPSTLNIGAGEQVTELEVFELQLHQPSLDEAVLRQIDREIPYHILFVLTHEGKAQAWIGYKQAAASGANAFKVDTYYHTEWMPEDELPLKLDGLTTDAVYEGYVRQIAGDKLGAADTNGDLQASVERDLLRQKLEKEIEKLEKKMRTEKQPKKKFELHQKLQELKKQLAFLAGYKEDCYAAYNKR